MTLTMKESRVKKDKYIWAQKQVFSWYLDNNFSRIVLICLNHNVTDNKRKVKMVFRGCDVNQIGIEMQSETCIYLTCIHNM